MAHNPVQIVLNSQNYVKHVTPQPGGSNTDFYADRNAAFTEHKNNVARGLDSLKGVPEFKATPLMYACVELQEAAWAKSHRPVRALFKSGKIRTLGSRDLGTIVVEVTESDIDEIKGKILAAESETNWVLNKTGRLEAKPSRAKSEVGAIKNIRPYSAEERRKFTVDEAAKWLEDPRTGGAYYVETFVSEMEGNEETGKNRIGIIRELYRSFKDGLRFLPLSLEISSIRSDLFPNALTVIKISGPDSKDRKNHAILLSYLDKHPAVKSILLPPVLQSTSVSASRRENVVIPGPDKNQSYPVVGIVDTGVAFLPEFREWQIGSADFLDLKENDVTHGTFIAGLVCAGTTLNKTGLLSERNCKFFDLGLHPTAANLYGYYYPRGFLDFLEQLDEEVASATKIGVRIFNMSLSVTLPVDENSYSIFANVLDQISDKHDVIFVLPAGNLDSKIFHKRWPDDPDDCLKQLAEYRYQGQDRVFQPADSLRSIAVGALEPPCPKGRLRPAVYTRRGPGPSLGAKPDVAHIGGGMDIGTGLESVSPLGMTAESQGTSFAAPLVAKTLASLEHAIEGFVTRETLCALLLHNSRVPSWLEGKKLSRVAKDFVGAGVPVDAIASLIAGDDKITLVFNGILLRQHQLVFNFTWPSSLTDSGGKCRGRINLTTVYRAPIDRDFGAEYVLTNVDTWLRQENIDKNTGESKFGNVLKTEQDKSIEKERITHGAKWWPVKQAETTLQRKGNSSQFQLVLESLCRSGYAIAEEGVPFCTILTISDPTGKAQIFDEMRHQLQASGVHISDIRTALQPRLRPGSTT
jgi:hypothetical protein